MYRRKEMRENKELVQIGKTWKHENEKQHSERYVMHDNMLEVLHPEF